VGVPRMRAWDASRNCDKVICGVCGEPKIADSKAGGSKKT
jgi:hypothetical protein